MRTILKQFVFILLFISILFVPAFFITSNAEAQTNSSPTYSPGLLPVKKYPLPAQFILWRDYWWPQYVNPALHEGPVITASSSADDPTLYRIAVRHGFVPHTLDGLETWASYGGEGRPVEGDEPAYSAYLLRTAFIQSIDAIHNAFEQQYGPRTGTGMFTVLRSLWDTQNWFPLDAIAGPIIDSALQSVPNNLLWTPSTTISAPINTPSSIIPTSSNTTTTNTTQTTNTSNQSSSTKFRIGDYVQTTVGSLNARSTANGTILGTQSPAGARGRVVDGSTFAGGFHWWYIDYNSGADGWSAENYLALVSGGTSTTTSTTFTPTNPITSTTSSSSGTSTSSVDVKVGVTGVAPSDGPFNVNLGTPISISWRVLGNTPCYKSSTPPSEFTGALTPLNSGSVNTFSPLGGITYKISCGNVSDTVVVNTAISNAPTNSVPVNLNPINSTPVYSNPTNSTPVYTNPVSTKFTAGDTVQSTTSLNVRNFANGTIIGTVSSGTQATVLGGPVSAGGLNWWRLSYTSGVLGWSAENYLLKINNTGTFLTPNSTYINSLTDEQWQTNYAFLMQATSSGPLNAFKDAVNRGWLPDTSFDSYKIYASWTLAGSDAQIRAGLYSFWAFVQRIAGTTQSEAVNIANANATRLGANLTSWLNAINQEYVSTTSPVTWTGKVAIDFILLHKNDPAPHPVLAFRQQNFMSDGTLVGTYQPYAGFATPESINTMYASSVQLYGSTVSVRFYSDLSTTEKAYIMGELGGLYQGYPIIDPETSVAGPNGTWMDKCSATITTNCI